MKILSCTKSVSVLQVARHSLTVILESDQLHNTEASPDLDTTNARDEHDSWVMRLEKKPFPDTAVDISILHPWKVGRWAVRKALVRHELLHRLLSGPVSDGPAEPGS